MFAKASCFEGSEALPIRLGRRIFFGRLAEDPLKEINNTVSTLANMESIEPLRNLASGPTFIHEERARLTP